MLRGPSFCVFLSHDFHISYVRSFLFVICRVGMMDLPIPSRAHNFLFSVAPRSAFSFARVNHLHARIVSHARRWQSSGVLRVVELCFCAPVPRAAHCAFRLPTHFLLLPNHRSVPCLASDFMGFVLFRFFRPKSIP